jgi:acyl-coenzyme A thioesterase PaaI-like protein
LGGHISAVALEVKLKVNVVPPIVIGTGPLRAEGRVIHARSRLATTEARLADAAGKPHVHAVGTCLVFTAK